MACLTRLASPIMAKVRPRRPEVSPVPTRPLAGPALFVSGSEDHIMPPAIQQSNAKHYKSNTITEIKEYEGYAHLLPAQKGWEQIADEVLDWALSHAR